MCLGEGSIELVLSQKRASHSPRNSMKHEIILVTNRRKMLPSSEFPAKAEGHTDVKFPHLALVSVMCKNKEFPSYMFRFWSIRIHFAYNEAVTLKLTFTIENRMIF